MALASHQADGFSGSTRLHCDLCDAINIMVFSSSATGTALWHIFKADDAPKLRAYINNVFSCTLDDPIHCQRYYLGPSHLNELKSSYDIVPFTIHQGVGEAVFIPAGCPHQVCYWPAPLQFHFLLMYRSATKLTVSRSRQISCPLKLSQLVWRLPANFDKKISETHGKTMFSS